MSKVSNERLATLCSEWPEWLKAAVDDAVQASDANDWSTEQVVGYALLSLRSASTPAKAVRVTERPVGEEAEKYRQARGARWRAIFDTLREYRMGNMCFEGEEDAYCLVDLMSAEGQSIADGEWEMTSLADDITAALSALEDAPQQELVAKPSKAEMDAAWARAYEMSPDTRIRNMSALEEILKAVSLARSTMTPEEYPEHIERVSHPSTPATGSEHE